MEHELDAADKEKISCDVAQKVLRKKTAQLRNALVVDTIPEYLFSEEFITFGTFENISTDKTKTELGRLFFFDVLRTVQHDYRKFEELCSLLDLHGNRNEKKLAQTLREQYAKDIIIAQEKFSKSGPIALEKLKENLRLYAEKKKNPNAPDADKFVEYDVSEYIKGRLQNKIEKKIIAEELRSLCYDEFLIPEELSLWCENRLEELYKDFQKAIPLASERESSNCFRITEPTPPEPLSPAELKNIIYHCGLCCQMVNSCTSKDYESFLSKAENQNNMFSEVSMSILRDRSTERYIIAKQKDAVYLAFLSEPYICDWMKKYPSFDKGFLEQMNHFPTQYLEEEILAKKKIVLTGFSFGGILASYITANLWSHSMISVQDLHNCVTCITFGQPFIDAPYVQDAIQTYDTMKFTMHSIYEEDDLFPITLQYAYLSHTNPLSSISEVTQLTVDSGENFQDDTIGAMLNLMDALQDKVRLSTMSPTYSIVASKRAYSKEKPENGKSKEFIGRELAEKLSANMPSTSLFIPIYSQYCYVIQHTKKGDEIVNIWKEFPSNTLVTKMFQSKLHECMKGEEIIAFTKHNITKYISHILKCFIEKPDEYQLPPLSDKVRCTVDNFKPDVASAVIHMYPSEHIVVLEGNRLLFCSNIILGEKSNVIKLERSSCNWKMTSKMIQINYLPPKEKKTEHFISEGKMKVTIHSHFCNPIRKIIPISKESFSFTPRQTQIAKYSPSQIIELAFLSAMLEQHSLSMEKPSQRFIQIQSFLEKAVQIVPLESIFLAIGYAHTKISLACAKAVYDSKASFHPSSMVLDGLKRASFRMSTGFSAHDYDSIAQLCFRKLQGIEFPDHVIIDVIPHRVASLSEVNVRINHIETLKNRKQPPYACVQVDIDFCNENKNDTNSNKTYAEYFSHLAKEAQKKFLQEGFIKTICGISIERLYPVVSSVRRQGHPSFQSPLDVLREAREKISIFIEEKMPKSGEETSQVVALQNEEMMSVVKGVQEHSLQICAGLLGSFMEQQIRIPLIKDEGKTTADKLSSCSSHVAIGCWALYSSTFNDLFLHLEENSIVVELADYLSDFVPGSDSILKQLKPFRRKGSQYSQKLLFLLTASRLPMSTVTCSSEYISYSLESQICKRFDFTKKESLSNIIQQWDKFFNKDALRFVQKSFRPIIGRWLKWATHIYDLRECLAKYTCVGVTGLVNSGKSQLVNKLFQIKTKVGTSAAQRTTVPMLYNLEDKVPGLDIIDFPGFDDKEHSIPEIADLFLGLAQIIIFVCDHKRTSCDSAKEWLEVVRKRENIPVIVCMTFADELYAEIMRSEELNPNPTELKKRKIKKELEMKRAEIGFSISSDFYCFDIPPGRTVEFNSENFEKVGINSATKVGLELVNIFEKQLEQPSIAENLKTYIQSLV